MPDNQAIVEILYKTAGVNDVKAGTAAIKGSDNAAKNVNKTMKESGAVHANALGISRREWMRTGSEAAFYARTALGSLGAVDKGLTQSIGLLTQLGESFMFGGGIGVALAAVSAGIGYLVGEMQKMEAAAKKALEPYEKLAKTLVDLDKISPALAQTMREQFNVTKDQAVAMAVLAESNATYRAVIIARNTEDDKMVRIGLALGAAKTKLTTDEIKLTDSVKHGLLTQADANKLLTEQREVVVGLTADLIELSKARQDDIVAMADQATEYRKIESAFDGLVIVDEDYARTLKEITEFEKQNKLAVDARANAIRSLAKAERDLLKSMIEKAISPTSVTQQDLDDTRAGTYKNKWDEVRRRFEAIAGGGGAEFDAEAAQLKKLGLSAKDAAAGFKDFSLFAGGANMELINFPELGMDVEKQIDSLLGKQKVMGKAFTEVYAKLPKEKKDALRELGITKLGDLERKNLGLDDEIVLTPKQSDDFISNLQKFRADIEAMLGGDIVIRAIYEGGSTGGGAMGYGAKTEALKDKQLEGYAEGGNRVVQKSGYVWFDRGEQFWNSGTRNQVAPPTRSGPIVGQVIVNNQQDTQRLLNDIARRVRIGR